MLLVCIAFVFGVLHSSLATNTTILFAEDTLEQSHGTVIFSSVVFRHGDRAVTNSYPNDPYVVESTWPEGSGELLMSGKERAYQLGKWFKQRYDHTLLKDGYRYDRLLMESSNVNRTIMSGLLVLAGAYPPGENEMWASDGLAWQPIPIHTIPDELDNYISLKIPCDRIDFEHDALKNDGHLQQIYLEYEDSIKYVAVESGLEMTNDFYVLFENLWDIYDALNIEEMRNLTLPSWTKNVYPEPLRTLGSKRFEVDSYTYQLKRLNAGPLLGKIVDDMKRNREGQPNPKIHFYSAHDTTVAPLLLLLGVYDGVAPSYCATVLIELRRKDAEYVVTVVYRESDDRPPRLLKVPGCDDICTLDKFVEITQPLIPADWFAECQVSFFTRLQYLDLFDLIAMLFMISLLGIVILFILRIVLQKRRQFYSSF